MASHKTGNYNFNQDLQIAQKTEKEISELLEQHNFKTIKFNNDNQYDLLVEKNNIKYKIEIKEDFQCGTTGNVAVEYQSRGKLSGIFTSKSDIYIYKMHLNPTQYFIMTKQNLLKIIKEKKYFKIVNGGDYGSNTMMYLFKVKELADISVVINK